MTTTVDADLGSPRHRASTRSFCKTSNAVDADTRASEHHPLLKVSGGIGDRRDESVIGLPRVKAAVLDHDRNVALNDGGVIGRTRNRLRLFEIVEPLMDRASRWYHQFVWACRLSIGEEDGDFHVSVVVAGVHH